MNKTVEMIGHGYYFKDLQILQRAVDHKRKIPEDYFEREENDCIFIYGEQCGSKKEIRLIRQKLIDEIVGVIESQKYLKYEEKMDADHYARYFHALAVLKVDKNILDKTSSDYLRNAFLKLWELDDGSEETGEIIMSAAWHISEAIKVLKENMYLED